MDYQNVEIRTRSLDSGIEAIAAIELGITSAREVVQAKRKGQTIQREDDDVMDGSLYRFDTVWGTIIASSRCSEGTEEIAFAALIKTDEPLHEVRGRLRAADVSEWTKAIGEPGASYHRVWSILEGES